MLMAGIHDACQASGFWDRVSLRSAGEEGLLTLGSPGQMSPHPGAIIGWLTTTCPLSWVGDTHIRSETISQPTHRLEGRCKLFPWKQQELGPGCNREAIWTIWLPIISSPHHVWTAGQTGPPGRVQQCSRAQGGKAKLWASRKGSVCLQFTDTWPRPHLVVEDKDSNAPTSQLMRTGHALCPMVWCPPPHKLTVHLRGSLLTLHQGHLRLSPVLTQR